MSRLIIYIASEDREIDTGLNVIPYPKWQGKKILLPFGKSIDAVDYLASISDKIVTADEDDGEQPEN